MVYNIQACKRGGSAISIVSISESAAQSGWWRFNIDIADEFITRLFKGL